MGELGTEEWKKQKKIQRAIFTAKQNLPYEVKLRRQARRAWEFWTEMESQDKSCHVSVGGLDSITLYIWLHSIGIHVTGITVSGIEDQSIQKVHRALGLEIVKSYKSKVTILNEIGFPVISKKIAGRINTLQNPTENNKTVRHAIITGECGAQGHYAKNSRMQLPLDMNRWYHEHLALFEKLYHAQPYGRNRDGSPKEYVPLESIVPEIYGTIAKRQNGELYTTGAQRTGCSMCGFGIHLEQRPHRFDKLRERNPKEWEFWMYRCYTDPNTGEKYGWGRVLDYIGVQWEDIPAVQMSLEDFLK